MCLLINTLVSGTIEAKMIKLSRKNPTDPLLTNEQAAQYLNMSEAFLVRDRWAGKKNGQGPRIPCVRIGRAIRYRESDLVKFIDKHTIESAD